MYKNLKFYGCSHGKMGSTSNRFHNWVDEKSLPWVLAKKLNLNLINNSDPGASNFKIFKNVYENIQDITVDDLVFVQWSYVDRIWCPSWYTVMPGQKTKLSKVYYTSFYSDLQEINKVLGYTLLLDAILPNFYFNFCDGNKFLDNQSPKTFQSIKNKSNYLNINSEGLTFGFKEYLIDGFHLNEKGQEILAQRYLDKLTNL